jgi:O-antigen ligase
MMYKAHLHNQWLQWGVEYGLVGILAWLLFFAALFFGALQSARWGDGRQRLCGVALAVCILALAVQQSSDLLMLHARGLQISLFWGLCLAGMKPGAWNEHR